MTTRILPNNRNMQNYLIVFFGAGLGGAARHAVNSVAGHLSVSGFPMGTLTVNVLGSAVMGVLIGWFAFKSDPGYGWRLFLTTGFLGGFTTFSAFSLDAALLYEQGRWAWAAGYVVMSVVLALLGLAGGLAAVRALG